jgi:hypothetical protein
VTTSVAEFNRLVLVPVNSADGFLRGINPGRPSPFAEVRLDSHLRSPPVVFSSRFLILARDGRVFGFQLTE